MLSDDLSEWFIEISDSDSVVYSKSSYIRFCIELIPSDTKLELTLLSDLVCPVRTLARYLHLPTAFSADLFLGIMLRNRFA